LRRQVEPATVLSIVRQILERVPWQEPRYAAGQPYPPDSSIHRLAVRHDGIAGAISGVNCEPLFRLAQTLREALLER
jgi:hypothetical protein